MKTAEREKRLRDNPFQPCGQCEDGMVALNRDGSPWDRLKGGPRYMRDCQCKRGWLRKFRGEKKAS